MYSLYGIATSDLPECIGTVCYTKWQNMLQRCYSETFQARTTAYKGVTVCDEWLRFSNFKEWFDSQPITEDMHLDKDILHVGNKIYSPATCCLVVAELNFLFTVKKKTTYATGVSRKGKWFVAKINIDGELVRLGNYLTEQEASTAYSVAKVQKIKRWLPYVTYDMRIVEGLNEHIERLENGHD